MREAVAFGDDQNPDISEAVAAATLALRSELDEKERKIQEQHKALVQFRALEKEQTATIARLTAELKSHEEAELQGDGPRELARIIARYETQIGELEETVAIRGHLIEQSVKQNKALKDECLSLEAQLKTAHENCDERIEIIEMMTREYEKRVVDFKNEHACLVSEIEILKAASGERLELIEVMTREFEKRSEAIQNERDSLKWQINILHSASGERLAVIDAMSAEFEQRTNALLRARDSLESQIEILNAASVERLALIEAMSNELAGQRREVEIQRAAAAERADIIARLETQLQQSSIRQRVKRVFGSFLAPFRA